MSNAYDSASLLVTPNGYEAGTIFSAKPTDGSADLSFSRASTALRRNSAGLWESVANNVPRLNYPVGGGCPSWLFEPQATNIVLNSAGNAATYTANGGATLTDTAMSTPFDGINSSVKVSTINSSYSGCYKTISRASAVNVNSVIVKKGTLDYMLIVSADGAGNAAWFNISNGTLGTVASGFTAKITSEGNGWYRCEVFRNSGEVASYIQVAFTNSDNTVGAVGDSYIVFGQNETGTVATSPIITAGSAVTRLKDVGESTVILSANNTVYYEGSVNALAGFLCDFRNNSLGRQFVAFTASDGSVLIDNYNNGTNRSDNVSSSGVIVAGTKFKFCLVSTATSRILFLNGVKCNTINESFSGGDRIFNQQTFSDSASMNNNNLLIYYTSNLSDSEAIALTTL